MRPGLGHTALLDPRVGVLLALFNPSERKSGEFEAVVNTRDPVLTVIPGGLDVGTVVTHLLEYKYDGLVKILTHSKAGKLLLGNKALCHLRTGEVGTHVTPTGKLKRNFQCHDGT